MNEFKLNLTYPVTDLCVIGQLYEQEVSTAVRILNFLEPKPHITVTSVDVSFILQVWPEPRSPVLH